MTHSGCASVLALCFLGLACGSTPTAPTASSTAGTTAPPPSSISSLEIAVAAPMQTVPLTPPLPPHIWTAPGQSAQLTALANGTIDVTATAEWSVTVGDAVTVTSAGMLTAVRAGTVPLRVTALGRSASTVVTVFRASPTTTQSFARLLGLGGRHLYVVTVGASGGDVIVALSSSEPGVDRVSVMQGTAIGEGCSPPYTFGTVWGSGVVSGGLEARAKGSSYQVGPGRYCVFVLDPAAFRPEDQLLPALVTGLSPMTAPVNYKLTVGVSGVGSSVISAP